MIEPTYERLDVARHGAEGTAAAAVDEEDAEVAEGVATALQREVGRLR
jgi:hypothetical protein